MGKVILLFIIIFLVGVIAYIVKTEVNKNDVGNNSKLKTKLDIEDTIRDLKLQILRAESDALRGKEDAEADLEYYKAQLKATEELLNKLK